MTGGIAHLGKDNENGAKLAIADLNKAGLTIGGQKVKFELLSEDDAADPKQGTAAAQKLVDAKVAGVIGHLNSGTTIPASTFITGLVLLKFHLLPPTLVTRFKATTPPFEWWPMTVSWEVRWAGMR